MRVWSIQTIIKISHCPTKLEVLEISAHSWKKPGRGFLKLANILRNVYDLSLMSWETKSTFLKWSVIENLLINYPREKHELSNPYIEDELLNYCPKRQSKSMSQKSGKKCITELLCSYIKIFHFYKFCGLNQILIFVVCCDFFPPNFAFFWRILPSTNHISLRSTELRFAPGVQLLEHRCISKCSECSRSDKETSGSTPCYKCCNVASSDQLGEKMEPVLICSITK